MYDHDSGVVEAKCRVMHKGDHLQSFLKQQKWILNIQLDHNMCTCDHEHVISYKLDFWRQMRPQTMRELMQALLFPHLFTEIFWVRQMRWHFVIDLHAPEIHPHANYFVCWLTKKTSYLGTSKNVCRSQHKTPKNFGGTQMHVELYLQNQGY